MTRLQILGGSISYGRGVDHSYASLLHTQYHFDVQNRAVPAVGSAFFCATPIHHGDVTIIETAFNDAFFDHPDPSLTSEATFSYLMSRLRNARVILLHICMPHTEAYDRCRNMYAQHRHTRLKVDVRMNDTVDGFHPNQSVHRSIAKQLEKKIAIVARAGRSSRASSDNNELARMWNACFQCSTTSCDAIARSNAISLGTDATPFHIVPGKPSVQTSSVRTNSLARVALLSVLSTSTASSRPPCRVWNGSKWSSPIAYTRKTSQQVFVRVVAQRHVQLNGCMVYGVCLTPSP